MKSTLIPLLAPATLLISLCSLANAGTVPAPIQARYTSMMAAIEINQMKGFDECFAPEFVDVDPSGKAVLRKEFLEGVHGMMMGARTTTMKVTFKDATLHDGIVDVSFVIEVKSTSANGVTTVHEVGVDSWKKIGGKWRTVKTVDTAMDIKTPKPMKAK